ncbi:hypothetical protein, partial [Pseudomonas syringae]|uniref:hypothetical protein n=1 Tax=Pseudomonas syringae TaxID=317 RepID=UPI00196843E7
ELVREEAGMLAANAPSSLTSETSPGLLLRPSARIKTDVSVQCLFHRIELTQAVLHFLSYL